MLRVSKHICTIVKKTTLIKYTLIAILKCNMPGTLSWLDSIKLNKSLTEEYCSARSKAVLITQQKTNKYTI